MHWIELNYWSYYWSSMLAHWHNSSDTFHLLKSWVIFNSGNKFMITVTPSGSCTLLSNHFLFPHIADWLDWSNECLLYVTESHSLRVTLPILSFYYCISSEQFAERWTFSEYSLLTVDITVLTVFFLHCYQKLWFLPDLKSDVRSLLVFENF